MKTQIALKKSKINSVKKINGHAPKGNVDMILRGTLELKKQGLDLSYLKN